MTIDQLVDAFVNKVNNSFRYPLQPDEVPAFLRVGPPDEHGEFMWKIVPSDFRKTIESLQKKLSKPFPPSFFSLISRYAFPSFETETIFFYGNSGENLFYELSTRIFEDIVMSPFLIQNGFIQIGQPAEGNYDPICFDTRGKLETAEEYPILQINHEEILCNKQLVVVKEIASSFVCFVEIYLQIDT